MENNIGIALTMIVKNEENNLVKCLERAKDFVDEIIIVDTGSTDRTKEIAQKYTDQVFDFEWNDNFSEARNLAFSKSSSDWNLVLDADETITYWNKELINDYLKNENFVGKILINSYFLHENEKRSSAEYVSRMVPKGIKYSGRIHEQIDSSLVRVQLPIEVSHTGYFMTDKFNRNIKLLQQELSDENGNPYILYQIGKEYSIQKNYEKAITYLEESYKIIGQTTNYSKNLVVTLIYAYLNTKEYEKCIRLVDDNKFFLEEIPDYHYACGIFYMHFIKTFPQLAADYLYLIRDSYKKCLVMEKQNEIVAGTSDFLALYNLGVFYEVIGDYNKAMLCYQKSSAYNYEPSKRGIARLKQ